MLRPARRRWRATRRHVGGVGRNNGYGTRDTLRTLARNSFTLNFNYRAAGSLENMGKGCVSFYPGGPNYVLCDGSVHFISETTNKDRVIRPLAWRNDGEPFESPW